MEARRSKKKNPVPRRKTFEDVVGVPDMGYELLMKQKLYRDALALCRVNKSVASVCRTERGKKILLELEAENSLESFIRYGNDVGGIRYNPIGSDVSVPLETANTGAGPGWTRFLKDRMISRRLFTILSRKDRMDAEQHHLWSAALVEAMRSHPITAVHTADYQSNEFASVSILDEMAGSFFGWTEDDIFSPGELLQLLDIKILTNVSYEITLDYERWMQFFQKGMSSEIRVFKLGVW